MNKTFSSLALVALSTVIVGCDSVRDHASHMQNALGIPVNVAEDVADEELCLIDQMRAWSREFQELPQEKKTALRQKAQNLQSVEIVATRVPRVRSGEMVSIEFGFWNRDRRWRRRLNHLDEPYYKSLVDNRAWAGPAAGTITEEQANVLTLGHNAQRDNSIWRRYITTNGRIWDSVTAVDATFDQYRSRRRISLLEERVSGRVTCGDFLTIEQILADNT